MLQPFHSVYLEWMTSMWTIWIITSTSQPPWPARSACSASETSWLAVSLCSPLAGSMGWAGERIGDPADSSGCFRNKEKAVRAWGRPQAVWGQDLASTALALWFPWELMGHWPGCCFPLLRSQTCLPWDSSRITFFPVRTSQLQGV